MIIFDYFFYGKDIDKVPEQLKVVLNKKKAFFLKNLIGTNGEVRLFKNQETYILCFERNYYREVETIVMNFENDLLHLTVITRSLPALLVFQLFQMEASSQVWFEKQFAKLTTNLEIKFERVF